ncbi:MAG: DPP IV N-terminal domain-containing protein [Terriglobia bacterium]
MRLRKLSLLPLLLAILMACTSAVPAADKKPLTVEDLVSGLTGPLPSQVRWSPDGQTVSFLLSEDKERTLWAVDVASGEKRVLVGHEQLKALMPSPKEITANVREEEFLLRYRVPSYLWSPDSKSILFTWAPGLVLIDLESGATRALLPDRRAVRDPKFSPDGTWVAFIYQHNLWAVPAEGGEPFPLTTGGNQNLLRGELDWVYPEELGVRTGHHWSPDSKRIAFLELDENPVPTYAFTDMATPAAPTDFMRYPKAGDPNPRARVGIVEIEKARQAGSGLTDTEILWLDRAAEYIPRIAWVDEGRLAVQLLDRRQRELELVLLDTAAGRSATLLRESDHYWVDVTDDLTFLSDKEFLWTSARDGYRHIYFYGPNGPRALTAGAWEVLAIEGVDQEGGWVYYRSKEDNPLGADLYRIQLDGTGKQRLSGDGGTSTVVMNPAASAYVETHSSREKPPTMTLRRPASGGATVLGESRSLEEYALETPEALELKTTDGALVRGWLFKPAAMEPGKKVPAIVYIYGMPHVPTIRDAWGGQRFLYHQWLAQEGFVVMQIDDRTSSRSGHQHATEGKFNVGPVAHADYRLGVKHLRSLPYVDADRIGIWGWSGGGFSTTFALTHSTLFKAGIAVAPVTDWRLYDSIYTERYMGLPQEQPDAYKRTSAVEAAGELHGRLFLIHGDSDDNVHIHNSLMLADALIKAGKSYDLLIYPNKTHGLRGRQTRKHLYRAMLEFWKKYL